MQDIEDMQLSDVVLFAIPFNNSAAHPQGAVLTDLAVRMEGVLRVRAAYKCNRFLPMSDEDPIIKVQAVNSQELKRACGYERMHRRYLEEYTKCCQSPEVLEDDVRKLMMDWLEENMGYLGRLLLKLGTHGAYFGDAD